MAREITVTELNRYVKTLLECDPVLANVPLRGEISNFTNHYKTGHFYFSLKDEQCAVKAVMFRREAQRLGFLPQNGMHVIVRCRISLFERDGAFQVYVSDMIPDGAGAMEMALKQLKKKLEAEGLFAAEHKKPLPAIPRCVGLVTSKTGAALQDILNVTRRRYPAARFLLAPVTVQGNGAAPEIANAVTRLDTSGRVDVIMIARGGGSNEDLWVFNSEVIARAVFACKTPVVSAIGHEIDAPILDLVADLRAPTPSAAAELVMPDLTGYVQRNRDIYANIRVKIQNRLRLCYNKLESYRDSRQLLAVRALPGERQAELCAQRDALRRQMQENLRGARQRVGHAAALCGSLNPYGVLARGYGVVQKEGKVLKNSADVRIGDRVEVRLYAGRLGCAVESIVNGESV